MLYVISVRKVHIEVLNDGLHLHHMRYVLYSTAKKCKGHPAKGRGGPRDSG